MTFFKGSNLQTALVTNYLLRCKDKSRENLSEFFFQISSSDHQSLGQVIKYFHSSPKLVLLCASLIVNSKTASKTIVQLLVNFIADFPEIFW